MDPQHTHHVRMTFNSRLRYFDLYKNLILDTLNYSKPDGEMPDHIKARLASAYLDLISDDWSVSAFIFLPSCD